GRLGAARVGAGHAVVVLARPALGREGPTYEGPPRRPSPVVDAPCRRTYATASSLARPVFGRLIPRRVGGRACVRGSTRRCWSIAVGSGSRPRARLPRTRASATRRAAVRRSGASRGVRTRISRSGTQRPSCSVTAKDVWRTGSGNGRAHTV